MQLTVLDSAQDKTRRWLVQRITSVVGYLEPAIETIRSVIDAVPSCVAGRDAAVLRIEGSRTWRT